MKIYKWLRGLMKASALTTVMFIMQACYGVPYNDCQVYLSGYVTDKVTGQPLEGIGLSVNIPEGNYRDASAYTDSTGYFELVSWGSCDDFSYLNIEVSDADGNYRPLDTVVYADTDFTTLSFQLERE